MKKIRYQNIDKKAIVSPLRDLFKWQFERMGKRKDTSYRLPVIKETESVFLQTNRVIPTITWIGHATFLIQMNGLNMITDPVWVKHIGIGKRLTPAGLSIEELPPIDIVFISHSHYDHLHYGSLKKLPGDPTFFVPIGLARSFIKKGLTKTIECRWWDEQEMDGLKIAFVPAQHWTRRTLFDINTSHWGGWIIRDKHNTVYFAGDSGYFDGFKEIGKKYDIDYSLMPIGSYDPEWFLAMQHLNPEKAVQACIDVGSKVLIPMHYGAFKLADDTPDEALDRLESEWRKRMLDINDLSILKIGETIRM